MVTVQAREGGAVVIGSLQAVIRSSPAFDPGDARRE
jgi:hypothetical protein